MAISASDLAGMRTTLTGFLVDSATITRTSQVLPCMVTLLEKDQRLGGLTDPVRIRRWQMTVKDGASLQVGDVATVVDAASTPVGTYFVSEMLNPQTYSVSTDAECIRIESTVAASTTRKGGAINPGQTSTWTTHIASLTVWTLAGMIVHSVSPSFMEDQFGVTLEQASKVYATWPAGATEDFPVQPNDRLVLTQGTYVVEGVQTYTNSALVIYVGQPVA